MASFETSHGVVRHLRGLSPHFQPKEPPRTQEEYVLAYGVNRHDAFIIKFQDRSARDPSSKSFEELTSEQVLLVLTRTYEQPGRVAERHLAEPHVPFLVAYLFLEVQLPDRAPQDGCSPALVLAKEYSNSFGLFSPISSPMWTTSTEWHGDKLALIYPRKDIYKLLLQTVQEEFCNSTLNAKIETWLDNVVKVFPEDNILRHATVRTSDEFLLRQHKVGRSHIPQDDVATIIRSPTPEDPPEWDFNNISESASTTVADTLAEDHDDGGGKCDGVAASARTKFLRSEADLYTRCLRTRSYNNPVGHPLM